MKLVILATLTFLAANFCLGFSLTLHNEGSEGFFHEFDFIQKMSGFFNIYKYFQSLLEKDKEMINELEKFIPVFINATLNMVSESFSEKCVQDMKYVVEESLTSGNLWALRMLDSYAKPESGLLMGDIHWLGKFDECVGIHAPLKDNTSIGDFRGQYCEIGVGIDFGMVTVPFAAGVCLPDSCNTNKTIFFDLQKYNLTEYFSGTAGELISFFSNTTLNCKATSKEMPTIALVVIYFIAFMVLLAVIGSSITAFEYYTKVELCDIQHDICEDGHSVNSKKVEYESKETTHDVFLIGCLKKCKEFFNVFCIFTNGAKLLDTSGVDADGQLPVIHGLRFWSLNWVILCHSYFFMCYYLNNYFDALEYMDRLPVQIISNGSFCVDSFFVLSGFLVGYVFLQLAPKTDGKIPWLYFYFHRFIRLVPVYAICGLFHAVVAPNLVSGPLAPDYDIVPSCKENWWYNALFINNFQDFGPSMCLGWTWFLADDVQYYIICPLFLITLWRCPKAGYSLLGLFFCMTFLISFILTFKYNLVAGIEHIFINPKDILELLPRIIDYFDKVYYKSYTRIGPYLVGISLSYYMYRRKITGAKRLNWVTLTAGWTISTLMALACVFGLYHHPLTVIEASFYNGLSRIAFGLAIAWVLFVCIIGQGGVVNSFLSWKAVIPLSRLTYCAYLVHPIFILTYYYSKRSLIYFNHMDMVMYYFGFLIATYGIALAVSLLFEAPIIRLEKMIRTKYGGS